VALVGVFPHLDGDSGREGDCFRVVATTIGGPYAVLIAEQLAASGTRVILGFTSAGQVSRRLKIPSLVVAARALRDEGTSYHYLAAAESVDGDARVAEALKEELGSLGLPIVTGPVWTTDAPYRETAEQLERHATNGILAVETQAASLFAFGAARGVQSGGRAGHQRRRPLYRDQFGKGTRALGFEILSAMSRAGRRRLGESLVAGSGKTDPWRLIQRVSGVHAAAQQLPATCCLVLPRIRELPPDWMTV
jgi:hypothetical protein